jgi:putative PIN family toxin of toxin-antitoxin system
LRAVLDPNVLISAVLAPAGKPAAVLRAWSAGAFELIASPLLLAELERALAYPKLRARIHESEATALIEWLRRSATIAPDPVDPAPWTSHDPGDDYLLALAAHERAALVSGDRHLLELAGKLPIYPPAAFLGLLDPAGL